MRPTIAACLAALSLLAAGCGADDNPESPERPNPGSEGKALAASDVEVVADAERRLRSACLQGTGDTIALPAARAIVAELKRSGSSGVFESGDATEAKELGTYVTRLAGRLDGCDAPRAQQVLRDAG